MRADQASCVCAECGVVCEGRYKGCSAVWARGPQALTFVQPEPLPPIDDEFHEPDRRFPPGALSSSPWSPVATAGDSHHGDSSGDGPDEDQSLAELRSEIRVVVDQMVSQQAMLGQWRVAMEAEVAQRSDLASLPERLSHVAREIQQEREGHLHKTEAMVANLVRPIVEECNQTRAVMASLSAQIEMLARPGAVGPEVTQGAGTHLVAHLEQRQLEIAKRQQELLATRLEGIVAEQHQFLHALEVTVEAGLQDIREDQRARITELERRLYTTMETKVSETLASGRESLPSMVRDAVVSLAESGGQAPYQQLEAGLVRHGAYDVDHGYQTPSGEGATIGVRPSGVMRQLEAVSRMAQSIVSRTSVAPSPWPRQDGRSVPPGDG